MDAPLSYVARAAKSYAAIRDYTCLFVKREEINGILQADQVTQLSIRTQPFSVNMKWQAPDKMKGQEVCYVMGRNNGKMRVKPTGGLSLIGFVSMDPTDPRAMENSRHPITSAGIGNLIDELARGWALEKQLGVTQVSVGKFIYANRPCTRVETQNPSNPGNQLKYYRTVVYFDNEHGLPIRIETYNWPRFEGDKGQLLEKYCYVNLAFNVGLPDAMFNK